jgi:hypothetical protein
MLCSLSAFMDSWCDKTKEINKWIFGLTQVKKFYAIDEERNEDCNDKKYCVYAWKIGNFVKIGMTGSPYESLMCSKLTDSMTFEQYRKQLYIGVSCSRIFQVVRLLTDQHASECLVLRVFPTFCNKSKTIERENKLRKKLKKVAAKTISSVYSKFFENNDGYTEFVLWENDMKSTIQKFFKTTNS